MPEKIDAELITRRLAKIKQILAELEDIIQQAWRLRSF